MNISRETLESHTRTLALRFAHLNSYSEFFRVLGNARSSSETAFYGRFPHFWDLFLQSIQQYIIIDLYNFFGLDTRNDKTSLVKLVSKLELYFGKNPSELSGSFNLSEAIKHLKSELSLCREITEKVASQRNKYWAHMDKKYFLDPGMLSNDFPLSYDDVNKVLGVLRFGVSLAWSTLFNSTSSAPVKFTESNDAELQKLIDLINSKSQ